jgi:hypothetical protein
VALNKPPRSHYAGAKLFENVTFAVTIWSRFLKGEDLPKMLMFCDWLSETKMIIVRDSFFRKTIYIVTTVKHAI